MKKKKFQQITYTDWRGKSWKGFFLEYKKYKNKGMKKYGARCSVLIDNPRVPSTISIWVVPEVRLKKGWKK